MNESMIRNMTSKEIRSNIDQFTDKDLVIEVLLDRLDCSWSPEEIQPVKDNLESANSLIESISNYLHEVHAEINEAIDVL